MTAESKESNDETPIFVGQIPRPVSRCLEHEGGDVEGLTLACKSDLAPDGEYGEQWLLLDEQRLFVLNRTEDGADLRYKYDLDRISDARIERCVGNGLLSVTVDEEPQVILHFSNEHGKEFGAVAQYLHVRADGGSDVAVPDVHANSNRCRYCGRPLLDSTTTVCPRCIQRSQVLKRLMLLAKPHWGSIGLIIVLLLGIVAIDLTPPYLQRILIDNVLVEGGDVAMLGWLVLSLLGLRLTRVGVVIWKNRLTVGVSSRFTAEMRERLFDHVKDLPVEYFEKAQTGRLMTRINQDTNELQGLVSELTMAVMRVMLVLGIGVMLFSMSPSLGWYGMIPAPLVMFAAFVYYKRMRPHFRRRWMARRRMNAMLNTFLNGVRVVKAFGQEDVEKARYGGYNNAFLNSILQVDLAWSRFFPIASFAFGAGGLIIWYVGGRSVMGGGISVGTLIAFLGYLGMFYGPLSELTRVTQALNRFVTISQGLFDLLDEEAQPQPALPVQRKRMDGGIIFDNVTFGYDPYNPVIRDLSMEIAPGELVGVVGHSGAGKSTLINLVCRFYDVTSGSIEIDGIDIREMSMEDIRRNIGVVLQRPYLFRGTIADNIAYGAPEASRLDIIRAAKAANAHDFVAMMPEGYDTIVGEGGGGLSGGERQRISIARAILNDPRILILDEATSSVDTKTERQIQEALNQLVKGRTTIAIAHRLSTLSNADRIVVMNHGRIEEQGEPQALLDKKGAFYDLVQLQNRFSRYENAANF